MVRLKRNYTDTSQFDNDILPLGKALATSLQWLYDDDEFEDDSLSEAEYDRNMLYYMDGVLPICDFMSVVTDVIYLAFKDFGGPNIKNYINLLQDFETTKWGDKPHLQYDGEYMILGKVSIFTTEVILWAAYLYCHIRKEFEPENERVVRADKLLYKLYARQTCMKPELVNDTFLMKHFNKTAVAFLKQIPTRGKDSKEEIIHSDPKSVDMEESVIGKISANNIRYYYEGWRNGKHGSICQKDGIYRFVEMARGKSGMLDDVNRNEEDNPIVAKGIVAYWLQFNSRMDTVIKRLTKYNCEIPKDIREQFDNYTQIRFEQFKREHRDDPNTWDWDWDREFYANVIIPHEMAFNKLSEALFDYISDSDIVLIRSVMNSYIKYLKKIRTEKGYQVNPELLVLRAVNSKDETKYEDLEDYEVKAILEKLKGEGYIDAMWVHGQERPWTIKILDKGRAYLKHLESIKQDVVTPPKKSTKKEETSKKQPKPKVVKNTNTFTVLTFTCTDLKEDQFVEQRLTLFCDCLLANFVAYKEGKKDIEREKIEKLFTGKPLKEDEKITWKAAKKELAYFFKHLRKHVEYSQVGFWDIVASHFIIETEGKKIIQGKKKVRHVAISADSLQSSTEKPKEDIMKKLDGIISILIVPIEEVLRLQRNNNEGDADEDRNKAFAEQDLLKELLGLKDKK